jgi:hypothetical protein
MNNVTRFLLPGDLGHPKCICRRDMRLVTIVPHIREPNTSLHTFECGDCGHHLKVTETLLFCARGIWFGERPLFRTTLDWHPC